MRLPAWPYRHGPPIPTPHPSPPFCARPRSVLFGTLDVEDDRGAEKFREDRRYSVPVGAIVGAGVGVLNSMLMPSPAPAYARIPIGESSDATAGV